MVVVYQKQKLVFGFFQSSVLLRFAAVSSFLRLLSLTSFSISSALAFRLTFRYSTSNPQQLISSSYMSMMRGTTEGVTNYFLRSVPSSTVTEGAATPSTLYEGMHGISTSLTLLEHLNLNIPEHKYAIPFYLDILGFGLDPRRAQNVVKGSGTVWYEF